MSISAEPKYLSSAELSEILNISERAVRKQVNQHDYYSGTYKVERQGKTQRLVFDVLKLYRHCLEQLETVDIGFNPDNGTISGKDGAQISPESLLNTNQRYLTLLISISEKYGDSITEGGRKSWSGDEPAHEMIDEMLRLRDQEGLSYAKIGEAINKSKATISRELRKVDKMGYAAYKAKAEKKLHNRGRKAKEVPQDVKDYIIKELAITDNISDICYHTKRNFPDEDLSDYIIRKECNNLSAIANGDIRNLQAHQYKRAKNYNRTYLPFDYSKLAPNKWWFMDYHIINNAEVLDEETGEMGRVRCCGIIDARTRRLVGYWNTVDTPNAQQVAQMVINTMYRWGMPTAIIVDGGSENIQSIRGIETLFRGMTDAGLRMDKVYFQQKTRGGLKRTGGHQTTESELPRQNIIERLWPTMDNRFSKRLKGQDLSGKGRTPKGTQNYTMLEFEAEFAQFVEWYNNEHEHRSLGCTPWEEYEKAKANGWHAEMPAENDRGTYEMHFAPRKRVQRSKGFGELIVPVSNPYGDGNLWFDISEIDPTLKEIYVGVAPDESQAAIYDENHNFLFVASRCEAQAGSDDTTALDQFSKRLRKQQENMAPIKKVIRDHEANDTLYEPAEPVDTEEIPSKGDGAKITKMIPKNMKHDEDREPKKRRKKSEEEIDDIIAKWM